MRRLPFPLLTLALAAATASGVARADAPVGEPAAEPAQPAPVLAAAAASPRSDEVSPAQADATPAPAATAPATPDAKVEEKASAKPEEKKSDGVVNARLAPGGVLAGSDDAFPLALTATLDNYAGNGFFAPGYQMQPVVGTSLSLRPSVRLPKLFDKSARLSGSVAFSVNNWLSAYSNSGVYERQVRVSDFGIGFILPGAYTEEITGISATPILSLRLPLSITSRQLNLFTSAAASVQLGWNSPETPVGVFSVQYTPSVRGNLYTQNGATIPCEAAVQSGGVVTNPLQQGDLPLAYGRAVEILPTGECVLRGRQSIAGIGNTAAVSWSLDAHSVSLELGHGLSFLRPLTDHPELSSEFSSGQNFTETSSGGISYTYTVPVDFQMFLTAGISSSQPLYSSANQLRFPFYDFVTPANNLSAAFFDVSVGL